MALGKFPEAIYDFTWALKLVTDLKEEPNKMNKTLEAIKEDRETPARISKYNRLAGNCYFEMSQYHEALQHYRQALQKEPDSAINLFNKGLVLSKMGQLKEANKELNLAREKFGNEKSNQINVYYCRYNLGINFRKLGDLDSSVIELKEATALYQDKPSAFNNLGLTYFERCDMDLAIDSFSKAIKLDPSAVHYNNRGLAYFHERLNVQQALEDFNTAQELND